MRLNRRQKTAAIAVASALGALSALGGTYAAFTAQDSTPPQVIASGTVSVDFQGGSFATPITNTSPGDVIERNITLVNTGTIAYSTVVLSQVSGPSLLTKDPLGYSVKVLDAGDASVVLAETKLNVFSAPLELTLSDAQKVAGGSTNLRFVYRFDAGADNTFQGLSDTVTFTVNATQRPASTFVEVSPNGSMTGH